jgi:hypothetical protein
LGEPRNWQDLEISIDFLNRKETANINITDLDFVLEANKYLQTRVLNGLSGGVGIFEGEPYTIKVGDPETPTYTFNGYLDFTDDATIIGGEGFSCSLKKTQGDDWINEVADSFSFAYLASLRKITTGDYVRVPYVINYIPDGLQLITLSISIYLMTKELIENVNELAKTIADITNASIPSPTVVATVVGPGVGYSIDAGDFIWVALKAIARIVYIIAITIAIINLIKEVFSQLLPPKRYHLGMTIRRMFERGCAHLNLNFQSSIPELEWVYIPSKNYKGGDKGEVGHPSNTDAIYTFGDLIREFKKVFNADFRIINGTFIFERKDSFEKPTNYKIPNYFSDQEGLLDTFKLNTDEMIANYNINWAFDSQDQNTLDDQTGRVFQAITTPKTVINSNLVNIKNLAEIAMPFSLGRYKSELTGVEEVARVLGGIVDSITGIFGKGTNFAAQIKDRVGSMLLSSDFITVSKIVKINGNKLDARQRVLLSAENLWFNYHFINSFAEINGRHNQFYRYLEKKVPMTLEEFGTLVENNNITDENGNRVIIEKLVYTPQSGTAIIDYRLNKKYTNNLKTEYVR